MQVIYKTTLIHFVMMQLFVDKVGMVVVQRPDKKEDFIPLDVCWIDFQPKGNITAEERSLVIGYLFRFSFLFSILFL